MKRILSPLFLILITVAGHAQDSNVTQKSFLSERLNDPMLPVYLVSALVLIVLVLVAWVAFYVMRVLNLLTIAAEKENAKKLGVVYVPRPHWWDRFAQQMNASVPIEKEKDIEMHHSYDGIKELDNHLPPWWKYLFYGTIAWGAIYIVVFHFTNTLPLQENEYETELAMAQEEINKFKASQPQEAINEDALVFANNTEWIGKGKLVFENNNCASCHGKDGGGNSIGPNLTDEYWLHGGDVKKVFHTIKNGVVEKGMPAWGKAMSPQDVRNVAFYIMSLQGTNPANAKAPQGEIFKQTAVVKDTINAQAGL